MVPINPPPALLGTTNAVVAGRGVRRYDHRFAGSLSVKAVLRGRATWETDEGRFELMPGAALVLNDGEEYRVSVDALQPVDTFCLFFERGFVEDAFHASTTSSAELLDAPEKRTSLSFAERLQFGALAEVMQRASASESLFDDAAIALVGSATDIRARAARLPALKASTRAELARRLETATSFLHAHADRGVNVAEAARAACLSPFHFQRLFRAFHGITPYRYLVRLRLERARLLLRGDVTVAEVALECGFESLGSFSVLFKRTFGIAPGAAKKHDWRNRPARGGATMAS